MLLVYPILAATLQGFLAHGVQSVYLIVNLPFFRGHYPSRRAVNQI
jgi:hypothetical protein